MRTDGCVFVDTPKECMWDVGGRCTAIGSVKLKCPFDHIHLPIAADSTKELVALFRQLLNSPGRCKAKSIAPDD